ncbi:MAG: endonuclease/exonuclease/phosphatase family protein [Janthinobacterium lividum]
MSYQPPNPAMDGPPAVDAAAAILRFATFNVLNLALPGLRFYDNIEPHSAEEYDAKLTWLAQQLDRLDADVVALQEIFSQEAVPQVLARTRLYRNAVHVGHEPAPRDGKLTPAVALISRLPVTRVQHISELPGKLAVPLPEMPETMTHFTRPILHAEIELLPGKALQLFVVHLKSKRPDYRNGVAEDDRFQLGAAVLRSLIKRATEALGLRYLLSDAMAGRRVPVMVMGDFNDVASAVSTQLVMGLGGLGGMGGMGTQKSPGSTGRAGNGSSLIDERLFDSYRIQTRRDPLRDVGFTHVHEGIYETIDHVLVSEDFNPASKLAIGEVLDVTYVNDHVTLASPEASDHGAVLVRIALREPASPLQPGHALPVPSNGTNSAESAT